MAFIHKVQFYWFMILVFIILLTLKLDGRINDWNWFIIFIPMWLLDSLIIVFTVINMIMHCKNSWWNSVLETSLKRKTWCLSGVLMKLLFEVLLCLRLQYLHEQLRLYMVMIPVWLFLTGCVIDVFTNLLAIARRGV